MQPIFLSNSPALARPQAHAREAAPRYAKARHWRVLHACEYARDILPVVEGQVAAGMRPYLVTPDGEGAAELYLARRDMGQPEGLSLLRAWQDVRNWRKLLLECDSDNASDVVHTHSFAAGMAGVRNLSCVVHDFKFCIEEFAISTGLCEAGSWMGRSFRVAEQFVLSRAQAVIVHSRGMLRAAEERGTSPENLFLIPDPLPESCNQWPAVEENFLGKRFGLDAEALAYFVPLEAQADASELSSARIMVLEAFSLVLAEAANSVLLIETPAAARSAIQAHAERLGITDHVLIVETTEASSVMQNATIVVATAELPADPVQRRQANETCLRAMSLGKPLLAADTPRNRDITPQGRGCLWFSDGDVRDLGYRMVFLARNPDFCATLAASAQAYIQETRASTAIGHLYDAAYRHAIARKKPSGPGQQSLALRPVASVV